MILTRHYLKKMHKYSWIRYTTPLVHVYKMGFLAVLFVTIAHLFIKSREENYNHLKKCNYFLKIKCRLDTSMLVAPIHFSFIFLSQIFL